MKDSIELVLATSWKPNRAEFLSSLGVSKGSFGEQLLGDVFSAFFEHSIDVGDEFRKYYSVEYANLVDYVEIRYGVVLTDDEKHQDRVFLVTWLPFVVDTHYDDNRLSTVLEQVRLLEEVQAK